MPVKLKPSVKKYVRDDRGKMTKKWTWDHTTTAGTSTVELKKMLENKDLSKKKNVILRELLKRNETI